MTIVRSHVYAGLILLEGALTLLAVNRGRAMGKTPRALIGGAWRSAADIARDLVLAAGMWGTWRLIMWLLPHNSGNAAVRSMLPQNMLEGALWVLLSCSAGFAEELLFRGWMLERLLAAAKRPAVAVVGQAVVFGFVHGYQGIGAMLRITIYGLFFGAVAYWRRSVRPGMIAHAWTDIAAGLLRL
jgi:membrane protease YdiL (CAAX protease family)